MTGPDEIESLALAVREGTASGQDAQRLQADAALRRQVLDRICFWRTLGEALRPDAAGSVRRTVRAGRGGSGDTALLRARILRRARATRPTPWLRYGMYAAAAALVLAAGLLWLGVGNASGPWRVDGRPLQPGEAIETAAGGRTICHGADGSLLQHTGPGSLTLVSGPGQGWHWAVSSGSLTAQIQPQRHPLELALPWGTVRVLGTRFQVNASPDGGSLWVQEGRVATAGAVGEQVVQTGGSLLISHTDAGYAARPWVQPPGVVAVLVPSLGERDADGLLSWSDAAGGRWQPAPAGLGLDAAGRQWRAVFAPEACAVLQQGVFTIELLMDIRIPGDEQRPLPAFTILDPPRPPERFDLTAKIGNREGRQHLFLVLDPASGCVACSINGVDHPLHLERSGKIGLGRMTGFQLDFGDRLPGVERTLHLLRIHRGRADPKACPPP